MLKFKIFPIFAVCLSMNFFAQEKNFFSSEENILKNVIPNEKLDFWVLIHNNYGKNREVKLIGNKKDFENQTSGFNLSPNENSFFYIVYSKGGKLSYITSLEDLKPFIGKADNYQEAALLGITDGYRIDYEFKNIAGNYHEDASNYYIDLSKITSRDCPYAKTHFTLTVDKKTGSVSNIKDNGAYSEIYKKDCKNNPRLKKLNEEYKAQQEQEKERLNPTKKRRR